MINMEELIRKMDELSELLNLVRKENVSDELFELCYNYRYEIIICRNTINKLNSDRMTPNQFLLVKQAKDNINRLYNFKDYILKLTLEKRDAI